MRLRDTREGYGLVSRLLHGTVAGLMLVNWLVGSVGEELEEGGLGAGLHASLGLLALLFALLWIAWRLLNPQPELQGVGPAERALARVVHAALMALALLLPASGVADALATGRPVGFFGLELVSGSSSGLEARAYGEREEEDEEREEAWSEWRAPSGEWGEEAGDSLWGELHELLAKPIFLLLLGLHVLAVLKHELWDRRPTLRRMFAPG